jgi:hypothetical protein
MRAEAITLVSTAQARIVRRRELSDFEQGFVESVLYRMGVPFERATREQFAAALSELDRYVRERRPAMADEDSVHA